MLAVLELLSLALYRISRMWFLLLTYPLFRGVEGGGDLLLFPDRFGFVHLVGKSQLRIGKGVVINGPCYINALGGVTIGDATRLAQGAVIYSVDHAWRDSKKLPYDSGFTKDPVVIADGCWIGANSIILPGTTLNRGCIVGAGAVVKGEFKAGSVLAGNPAKVIALRSLPPMTN